MANEEKQLLIKALCGYLPYGVIMFSSSKEKTYTLTPITLNNLIISENEYIEDRPYLRPMSSMTEEELEEYENVRDDYYDDLKTYDWLNAHHFDYRGLIEKGLALEAPKDMYKF